MRLIDADEFKEYILTYGDAGYGSLRIEKISELIDGQSTAYDIEEIVKKIDESSADGDGVFIHVDKKQVITKDLAIKIVKSGFVGKETENE